MTDRTRNGVARLERLSAASGGREDPEHAGWYSWGDFPRGSFAAATGRLLFRPDGPNRGLARMLVTDAHLNLGGSIHGGAVMSFIDMAMFAGGRCAGMDEGHYVTLDLTTHFLARGEAESHIDAHVEIVVRPAPVFMQGVCRKTTIRATALPATLKRVRTPTNPA